jgi:hypothetical protein
MESTSESVYDDSSRDKSINEPKNRKDKAKKCL